MVLGNALLTDASEYVLAFARAFASGAVLASVADTAIFPIQDVLGLGTEARMNVPGTADGNWGYRLRAELLSSAVAAKLTKLTETYERCPPSLRRDS